MSHTLAGAGDDASNVGVMMELASNLVAAPDAFPSSPVMLLFSGAEEPLCQARFWVTLLAGCCSTGKPGSSERIVCLLTLPSA